MAHLPHHALSSWVPPFAARARAQLKAPQHNRVPGSLTFSVYVLVNTRSSPTADSQQRTWHLAPGLSTLVLNDTPSPFRACLLLSVQRCVQQSRAEGHMPAHASVGWDRSRTAEKGQHLAEWFFTQGRVCL
jgi:hypothetical protein